MRAACFDSRGCARACWLPRWPRHRLPPTCRGLPIRRPALRRAVQLDRLLRRHQRRLRLGHESSWTDRLTPAPPATTSTSAAHWSAARSATICRPALWVFGAGRRHRCQLDQGHTTPSRLLAKRTNTIGSERRAAASAMPSIAGCPIVTGGAAFGDIKMTPSGIGYRKPTPDRLDRRRRPRIRLPGRTGRPRSNISMSISARRRCSVATCGVGPPTSRSKTSIVARSA